jgi:hypothetical protein
LERQDSIARVKSEPIESHERAVIARLLQALHEVLTDERLDPRDKIPVLHAITDTVDRSIPAIRNANPWVVERITAELDRRIEQIITTRQESR